MKKLLLKAFLLLAGLGVFFQFQACKRAHKSSEGTIVVEVRAESPLYEGINTAVGIWEVNLQELFPEVDFSKEKISSARFEEVILVIDPNTKVKNAKIEISGRNVDMQKIAFANNIAAEESEVQLIVAEEQKKIERFLQLDRINIVMDADLAEDLDSDFSALVKLKLRVNY
ncbi:MAG: hypothetical protein ACK4KT_08195 [Thermaurantimonas sp.]